eukprot:EC121412.1.p1 GENE.EC121412.1~~EC121412.1.p1  ORF type:complete len:111 (+),score=8.62 EC121412.1:143-475(+)
MSWRAALSKNLQELRVLCCPENEASKGLRDYITKNYSELKRLNPTFNILIRDGPGAEARLIARYDWGQEQIFSVENATEQEVERKLKELVLKGETMPRSPESLPPLNDII